MFFTLSSHVDRGLHALVSVFPAKYRPTFCYFPFPSSHQTSSRQELTSQNSHLNQKARAHHTRSESAALAACTTTGHFQDSSALILTNRYTSVSQSIYRSCCPTTHRHVNSDLRTVNCSPSLQTTQFSPAAAPSAQLLLASGTVCHSPFEQHHLLTLSDDT